MKPQRAYRLAIALLLTLFVPASAEVDGVRDLIRKAARNPEKTELPWIVVKGLMKGQDGLEIVGNLYLAYLDAKEADKKAAIMRQIEARLRSLETATKELPSLQRKIDAVRAALMRDKEEFERKRDELKAEMAAAVKELESGIEELENRRNEQYRQLIELSKKMRAGRARLYLEDGRKVEEAIIRLPLDLSGTVETISLKGEPKTYLPGQVTTVSLRGGYYRWVEGKKRFAFIENKPEKVDPGKPAPRPRVIDSSTLTPAQRELDRLIASPSIVTEPASLGVVVENGCALESAIRQIASMVREKRELEVLVEKIEEGNEAKREEIDHRLRSAERVTGEIPHLRALVRKLQDARREQKQEFRSLLEALRDDMKRAVDHLQNRMDESEDRIRQHANRITDLALEAEPPRAKLLQLRDGRRLEQVEIRLPIDPSGSIEVLSGKGDPTLYAPGQVTVVVMPAGTYTWMKDKFVFRPNTIDDVVREALAMPLDVGDSQRDRLTSVGRKLQKIFSALPPAETQALIDFAGAGGHNWEQLTRVRRLEVLRDKIAQDSPAQIRKKIADEKCSAREALSLLIGELAEMAEK